MSPWNQIDSMERTMYSQRLYARTAGVTAAVALPTVLVFGLVIALVAGFVAFGAAYAWFYVKIGREIEATR